MYAHSSGDVRWHRRGPTQLANTLGFVVGRNEGSHLKRVAPAEVRALHETLSWLRTSGNNPVHRWFGTVFETFVNTCRRLADSISTALPVGDPTWRIRATPKPSKRPREGIVGETIGDERQGMVILDMQGVPTTYAGLDQMRTVLEGKQEYRLHVEVPTKDGTKRWRRAPGEMDLSREPALGEAWRHDMIGGAKFIAQEAYISATDPHYDAKVFPVVHPHGTGSLLAEVDHAGIQRFAKNRLTLIQSWFRRSPMWNVPFCSC